jgi:hypothetical protein
MATKITVDWLIQQLRSDSELKVRNAVSEFVLGSPVKERHRAVPALIDVFTKSESGTLLCDCAIALGMIGGEQARVFLRSQMAQRDPLALFGVASGLFLAGDKPLAVRMYYKMMESEDPEIRKSGFQFAADHGRPVPEDMLFADGTSVASLVTRSKMPGLEFADGTWVAKCDWPHLTRTSLVQVLFAHSTAEDGPDDEQYETLAKIAKMKKAAWKKIHRAVVMWERHQGTGRDLPNSDADGLSLDYIVIPKAYLSHEHAFAVVYRSDWEVEHGIEAFVFDDGRIVVGINDGVSLTADWPQFI